MYYWQCHLAKHFPQEIWIKYILCFFYCKILLRHYLNDYIVVGNVVYITCYQFSWGSEAKQNDKACFFSKSIKVCMNAYTCVNFTHTIYTSFVYILYTSYTCTLKMVLSKHHLTLLLEMKFTCYHSLYMETHTFSGAVKVNNGKALTVFILFKVHKVCQNVSTSPTLFIHVSWISYIHTSHTCNLRKWSYLHNSCFYRNWEQVEYVTIFFHTKNTDHKACNVTWKIFLRHHLTLLLEMKFTCYHSLYMETRTFSGAVKVNNGKALTVFILFIVHKVCQNVSTSPTLFIHVSWISYIHTSHTCILRSYPHNSCFYRNWQQVEPFSSIQGIETIKHALFIGKIL